MTLLERIAGLWFAVLDASARGAASLGPSLWARRRVHVRENGAHGLDLVNGAGMASRLMGPGEVMPARLRRQLRRSRVTLDLDPGRFLFRSIDVPARASEFAEAIVRSQIDRLTPWRPESVLFGWSVPAPSGSDANVPVAIAATDAALVTPLLDRLQALGVATIEARVSRPVDPAQHAAEAPLVIVRRSAATSAVPAWKRAIGGATAAVVALVIGTSLYAQVAAFRIGSELEAVARDTAAKRAELARVLAAADPAAGPRLVVERRKAEVPVATLAVETVARLLPDDSYVTSFDLSGTRLQLVGFTRDAPALIRVFGGAELFSGASFFAPTTRLAGDPADRFSIEATIRSGAAKP